MILTLGIIIGILLSILNVCVLIYFRTSIEYRTKIIETRIHQAGPRPKGYVFEPDSEIDEARDEIIAKNRKKGRDTNINELI